MFYKTHKNPLYVRCHECHKDITLQAQYIMDCMILCGDCNEMAEGWDETGELDITVNDHDSNN